MSYAKIQSVALDANETFFFSRELEYIKSKSYDIEFPEMKAFKHIPISTEAGEGAQSITYAQFEETGFARVIESYADDLPRADIRGKEYTSPVKSIGVSYGYSVQEIRAAIYVRRSLTQRQANAARRANDKRSTVWLGLAITPIEFWVLSITPTFQQTLFLRTVLVARLFGLIKRLTKSCVI